MLAGNAVIVPPFPEVLTMKRLSAGSLTLFLLLASASSSAPAKKVPPKKTPYYPLEVGNTWHYKAGEAHFIQRVTRFEMVGKVNCARLELFGKTGDTIGKDSRAVELVGVTMGEVARYSYAGKDTKPPAVRFKPPVVFLKFPPRKELKWKVDSKGGGQLFKGSFTMGKEDKVVVPAGTYEKVVTVTARDLDIDGTKYTITYYFARNVGMVKQVIEVGRIKVVIELEKFEPGKG
jgi:hypothetical protein